MSDGSILLLLSENVILFVVFYQNEHQPCQVTYRLIRLLYIYNFFTQHISPKTYTQKYRKKSFLVEIRFQTSPLYYTTLTYF